VRSGFVYRVAESTATEEQHATAWSSEAAVENSRLKAAGRAFQGMLNEYEKEADERAAPIRPAS
jgi:hypothetical protein